jgi:dTDP-D-glucose 4,6-dehydratase
MNLLITGGCGFIGINYALDYIKKTNNKVIIVDKISYLSKANYFYLKKNFSSRIIIIKTSINNEKNVLEF